MRANIKSLKQRGSSLLEVVTAVGIMVLVLIALVRLTTVSVRNAAFARNQAMATKLTGEVRERMRDYRDSHTWASFVSNCDDAGEMGFAEEVGVFTLSADCDCSAVDACDVEITAVWTDDKGDHQSELVTRLTDWK